MLKRIGLGVAVALSAAQVAGAAPTGGGSNTCIGGDPLRGDPPVSVEVFVSQEGAPRRTAAVWRLSDPVAGGSPPFALIEFPMNNGAAAAAPDYISIFEMVAEPLPPTPTATIVLLVDGVEKTRRPWGLFARRASVAIPADATSVGLFGIVPFNPKLEDGTSDAGLASLLASIGDGSARSLEVRLIGERGRTINTRSFSLADPPVRDPARLSPKLAEALEKAAAPTHCARQTPPG